MAADTNGDGRVSQAEFMAVMTTGKGDPGKRFAHLDRNGDGFVDRTEIDDAAAKRFRRLDSDGDGRLTHKERKAGRAPSSDRSMRSSGDDSE
ncbi:EF-hand domain-containing protein [Sphingomonas sp. CARO-RG-8B-R24-01]|uniref:EF-hand domain-containing protein n=1 Tax=Sphingomonas sp. CARO-RG-8B-R24-01 TaxID=2914831 RepID=UPI001F5A5965|nr:EF-hand domain-containing protein [Sphingomonas sp. CARO-RG-8B-R24-01]